jgi:ElaB/YqjD/DUF883 family membrane-anchored ribosome-binding protein
MADEQEPEVIRRQMEAQRAALDEKLDALENRIVQTVDDAREAVAETVQTVKEGVHDSVATVRDSVHSSVETVKDALNVESHVQRHPWAMFGGSIAAGFAAGWLLRRWGAERSVSERGAVLAPPAPAATPAPAAVPTPFPEQAANGASWTADLGNTFAPELEELKGFAIGAVMGLVRDLVTESLPDAVRPRFNAIADSITTKLGGQPVQSEVVNELLPHGQGAHHNGRHPIEAESHG